MPFGPGSTSFHSGVSTHVGSALGIFGEPQFEPFHGRSKGRGKGVCTVKSLILFVYSAAAALSAVPLSAEKPPTDQFATGICMFDWPLHRSTSPHITAIVDEANKTLVASAPLETCAI